jgi:hypothetical protein
MCLAIAKPTCSPEYNALEDADSWGVSTHCSYRWVGTSGFDIGLPYGENGQGNCGSVYHFTANIATGELRVRPVVRKVAAKKPVDPLQTEWTIASGIAGLAEYRLIAMVAGEALAVTLLWANEEQS